LLGAQLEMQEQTFQKISRDIHDNISLSLSLAKLDLHTINWNEKEKAIEQVQKATSLVSKSITELSDISKSLHADIIKQQGLLSALKDELAHIEQPGLFKVNFIVDGEPVFLESSKELIIFRIIQESFNNIIKHAAAKLVTLHLTYSSDYLNIIIADDGKGFDKTQCQQKKQAGLRNMAARAQMLAGKMVTESQPGNGTTLSFTIPFK
jgi:signal transduction histidine kinase